MVVSNLILEDQVQNTGKKTEFTIKKNVEMAFCNKTFSNLLRNWSKDQKTFKIRG